MVYGFDREALIAAKRWYKLDRDSNEARLYLGQLSFRVGDIRAARRHFSELIETGKEEPGEISYNSLAFSRMKPTRRRRTS